MYIAFALVLLFVGAEGLVRGSSSLALRAGLNRLMVGLTIVAFGTSSPELVVSVEAALSNQGDISVGNVVGSNIFNIAVILGITALVCPIPVHRQVIKIDAPVALGVALLLVLLLLNQTLSRLEGVLLFSGIVAYTWMSVILARREPPPASADEENILAVNTSRHWCVDIALILVGLAILVAGSRLLVENSVALAVSFGISEAVIGLTIVAAGTSMPELATSLVAAFRKQPDIAIGNIVGSNIFNVLGILGVASIVSPIEAPGISTLDYGVMILFTVLLIPLLYTGRMLHRVEGAVLLALYFGYLFLLWPD
ncbi:MAG: calcium/sodium antiporter [Pseudomonadota bacterium]|uniref:Inner membrane protein YrbG, predicted calcium/sodium:proton antiporter n=2 Tax=Marinobacter TaxID=2742 RepID=A0A833JQG2_MARNT|nr:MULTISPECIES: calcium/sodium antiporter [Marinobacter]KAE8545818.1 Inner membrane protein YrbG, predicted calcium/sodium:proton antiporter [Marinobacter nauticus]MCK7553385.1 calcium/sodium antiporter [Marinobacter goseongensis]MDX5327502.1 calcium/sodium antiporter [Marinobacter sp.]WBU43183.1 calcium/sodium antiporter [Marinobacter alkaliphilus]